MFWLVYKLVVSLSGLLLCTFSQWEILQETIAHVACSHPLNLQNEVATFSLQISHFSASKGITWLTTGRGVVSIAVFEDSVVSAVTSVSSVCCGGIVTGEGGINISFLSWGSLVVVSLVLSLLEKSIFCHISN